MIFFCRKTSTADGRTRWSVCVPTLMGFTTIAWFYSEALADNFIRHLENDEEDRQLASLDAWREFQFRLDFLWCEKLQKERAVLESHWQSVRDILLRYSAALAGLLRETDPEAADRDARIGEGFQAIWESAFTAMRGLEGLEPLADLLEGQSRVHGQLRNCPGRLPA